ncbi:hypothetical protein [Fretibacter rubidus]|uniref:hypothetical protein n=1 Tax=Fretibacter rubidus TaxID=570162 RepID=UPI00352AE8B1
MRKFSPLVTVLAALSLGSFANALSATQTIEKEKTVITDDGSTQIIRTTADTVVPGETIVYTLNFVNDDGQAADNLVLTMPVPEQVTFVEGSADRPGTVVVYSADSGQSFATRQATMVMTQAGEVRAAGADDITHVRWTIPGPVAAGETGQLSFAAKLK